MLNFWEGSGSGPVIENHNMCGSWINLCFEDLFGGGTLACHVEGLGLVSFFSTAKEQLGNETQDKPDSLSPVLPLVHWLMPSLLESTLATWKVM